MFAMSAQGALQALSVYYGLAGLGRVKPWSGASRQGSRWLCRHGRPQCAVATHAITNPDGRRDLRHEDHAVAWVARAAVVTNDLQQALELVVGTEHLQL